MSLCYTEVSQNLAARALKKRKELRGSSNLKEPPCYTFRVYGVTSPFQMEGITVSDIAHRLGAMRYP